MAGGVGHVVAFYTPLSSTATQLFANRKWCPRVRSLLATHSTRHITRVIPIRCKCWSCSYCAPLNAEKLLHRVLSGKPTKFITLTTRPLEGETTAQTAHRCRPQISRLLEAIRKTWGPIQCAIILELTKKGNAHWHLCARCGFIPQHWLSDQWRKLTGAYIVDIRRIRDPRNAARYVAKYTTKTAPHTAAHHLGRLYSFTSDYLIGEQTKSREPGWQFTLIKRHPLEVLDQQPKGLEISYQEGFFELRRPPEQTALPGYSPAWITPALHS